MRRIIAQARKELTQLLREPPALGWRWCCRWPHRADGTSVADGDRHPDRHPGSRSDALSRRYADAFRASLTYRVITLPPDVAERMLAAGPRGRGVIVPSTSSARFAGPGRWKPVLVDATDGNTAQLIRGSATQVTRAFARQVPARRCR